MRFTVAGIVALLLLGFAGTSWALEAGGRLPEIGLNDLSGRRIDAASLAGKVVVVDFLASWCAPCKQEMPVLDRLYKKHKDKGLVVVGVSVDEEVGNLRGLLKQVRVTFPIVHDGSKAVAGRFKPPRMPSSYIVDRKGIVRFVHAGFRADDAAKIESQVTSLLAK
jgi:thiol-disulfide isomerase/thioredoxin